MQLAWNGTPVSNLHLQVDAFTIGHLRCKQNGEEGQGHVRAMLLQEPWPRLEVLNQKKLIQIRKNRWMHVSSKRWMYSSPLDRVWWKAFTRDRAIGGNVWMKYTQSHSLILLPLESADVTGFKLMNCLQEQLAITARKELATQYVEQGSEIESNYKHHIFKNKHSIDEATITNMIWKGSDGILMIISASNVLVHHHLYQQQYIKAPVKLPKCCQTLRVLDCFGMLMMMST